MIWLLYVTLWLVWGAAILAAFVLVLEANHEIVRTPVTTITLADVIMTAFMSAIWPAVFICVIGIGAPLLWDRWHPCKVVLWRRKPPQA